MSEEERDEALLEAGRQLERELIVRWLRNQATRDAVIGTVPAIARMAAYEFAAEDIAAGKHRHD